MTDEILQPVDMHDAFERDPSKRDASRISYTKLPEIARDVAGVL